MTAASVDIVRGREVPFGLLLGGLGFAVLVLAAVSVLVGRAGTPLSPGLITLAGSDPATAWVIFSEIRLPRALLGAFVGASLGLAGAVLQGLLRNPLAEPGLIGASSGAALAAVVVLYFGLAAALPVALPLAGMAGALAAVSVLFVLAGREAGTLTLILAGVAINSLAGALTALALNLAPNPYSLADMVNWMLGSVDNRSWLDLGLAAPGWVAGACCLLPAAAGLRALSLGEETAASLGAFLEGRLEDGAYENLEFPALAEQLTEDIRAITNDRHCSVQYNPGAYQRLTEIEASGEDPGEAGPSDEQLRSMAAGNYAFRKLEILTGNVGYLDFRGFMPPAHAADTAAAAMAFLSNSDAIIIDLRQNGGGDPAMVQFICSYFFPAGRPVHLNSLYFRPADSTTQFWTLPHVPGKRMPDTPLFILTSGFTFSGAEEFAYNMQTQGRATLVGETTGGGANPGGTRPIAEGFVAFIPEGRAINPVTEKNWEGTGVTPDILCTADEALERAHLLAVERIAENPRSPRHANALEWQLDSLRARLDPVEIDQSTLARYAGSYGAREVFYEDGRLLYSRGGGAKRPLIALDEATFMIEGVDFFKLRFVEEGGKVTHIQGMYNDGRTDRSERED